MRTAKKNQKVPNWILKSNSKMERISARKGRGFYSEVERQKNLGTGPTLNHKCG